VDLLVGTTDWLLLLLLLLAAAAGLLLLLLPVASAEGSCII